MPVQQNSGFLLLSGLVFRAVGFILWFFLLERAERPFGTFPEVWGYRESRRVCNRGGKAIKPNADVDTRAKGCELSKFKLEIGS